MALTAIQRLTLTRATIMARGILTLTIGDARLAVALLHTRIVAPADHRNRAILRHRAKLDTIREYSKGNAKTLCR